jgi:hypothetical protein
MPEASQQLALLQIFRVAAFIGERNDSTALPINIWLFPEYNLFEPIVALTHQRTSQGGR